MSSNKSVNTRQLFLLLLLLSSRWGKTALLCQVWQLHKVKLSIPQEAFLCSKSFYTTPYLIMHAHLIGDTLNNKAPYLDAWWSIRLCRNFAPWVRMPFAHAETPSCTIAKEVDPYGVQLRKRWRFTKSQYLYYGPNFCWHADGK